MEQSHTGEAKSFTASHEFPYIQNQKFHYRVHNSLPLLLILSKINPHHDISYHFINFNLILSKFMYVSSVLKSEIYAYHVLSLFNVISIL
jgi:hypothetical protein